MRYFIGNWKMFGVPKSISILNKINSFYVKDKNRNKYRVIITPPHTLIESYAKYFKNKNMLVYTWTINDSKKARKLRKMNVDAITTDRPAWLGKKLQTKS